MANDDIRNHLSKKKIRHWQVADRYGVHEGNFSRMLRRELPDDKKDIILQIIEDIEREANARG